VLCCSPEMGAVMQETPVQEQALSATYRNWRELRHHLERSSGVKVEECPVCHGGDCVHSAHADGNLKLDVVDLSQHNYASRYEDVPGSLAVPIRHVVRRQPYACCRAIKVHAQRHQSTMPFKSMQRGAITSGSSCKCWAFPAAGHTHFPFRLSTELCICTASCPPAACLPACLLPTFNHAGRCSG